jgi:hypothetical protein
LIKGIKKYGKADRRRDLGNLIVVWGMMPLLMLKERGGSESDDSWLKPRGLPSSPLSLRSSGSTIILGCSNFIVMPTRGSDNFMTVGGREVVVEGGGAAVLLSLD